MRLRVRLYDYRTGCWVADYTCPIDVAAPFGVKADADLAVPMPGVVVKSGPWWRRRREQGYALVPLRVDVELGDFAVPADLIGPERSEGPHLAPRTLPLDAERASGATEASGNTPDTLPANRGFSCSSGGAGSGSRPSSEAVGQRGAARYGGGRTA